MLEVALIAAVYETDNRKLQGFMKAVWTICISPVAYLGRYT